jgi:hypothetical protein
VWALRGLAISSLNGRHLMSDAGIAALVFVSKGQVVEDMGLY